MDDQRTPEGEVPLSALLAPSVYLTDGGKLKRFPPTGRYIAALRAEGRRVPEQKPFTPDPVDASGFTPAMQIFYVKLAAREGDWRSLRGTKPTPKMQDLFVTARAKYLAWKHRQDEEPELPKFWFEIEPGHWVNATDENAARTFADSMKTQAAEHTARERIQIDIDTSKTCPRCRMRRVEPDRALCGNCISLETPNE